MHRTRLGAGLVLVAGLALGVHALSSGRLERGALSPPDSPDPAAALLGGLVPLDAWLAGLGDAERARIDAAERAHLEAVWRDLELETQRLAERVRGCARELARQKLARGEHRLLADGELAGPRHGALLTILQRSGGETQLVHVRREDSPELAARAAELERWRGDGEAMLLGAIAEAAREEGGGR